MNRSKATTSPIPNVICFSISTDPGVGTTVLIDGTPLVLPSREGFLGFLPADLFSAALPLLPASPPRRVPIARCSCGVVGCGNTSPLIAYGGSDEELVIWTDFCDIGSHASSPSEVDQDIDPEGRHRLEQDDLVFDRLQYETAVLAASADRAWETPGEATARLLRGMLATDAGMLRSLGFTLSWVSPSWQRAGAWTVSLLVPYPHRTIAQRRADAVLDRAEEAESDPVAPGTGRRWTIRSARLRLRPWERAPHQALLEVTTASAAPAMQAADLYRQLTDHPLADWERTFPRTDHDRC